MLSRRWCSISRTLAWGWSPDALRSGIGARRLSLKTRVCIGPIQTLVLNDRRLAPIPERSASGDQPHARVREMLHHRPDSIRRQRAISVREHENLALRTLDKRVLDGALARRFIGTDQLHAEWNKLGDDSRCPIARSVIAHKDFEFLERIVLTQQVEKLRANYLFLVSCGNHNA